MILSIISAFISTIGICFVFQVQKKHVLTCGLIGAIGWAIYSFGTAFDLGDILSTFIASLSVTFLSLQLSRTKKTPVTVFLIPGIIPLVPGLGLYRTMYAILLSDYNKAADYAILTTELAGTIAGAIIIISVLPLLKHRPHR